MRARASRRGIAAGSGWEVGEREVGERVLPKIHARRGLLIGQRPRARAREQRRASRRCARGAFAWTATPAQAPGSATTARRGTLQGRAGGEDPRHRVHWTAISSSAPQAAHGTGGCAPWRRRRSTLCILSSGMPSSGTRRTTATPPARRNKAGRRDPAAPAGISGAAGVAHVGGARSIN